MPARTALIRALCLVATAACTLAVAAGSARAGSGQRGVGIMADIGVPDGMVAAIAVQPHRRVAVHAGGGHNTVSPGLRAGVQVYPLLGVVAPYVAVEAGHYFAGGSNVMAMDLVADRAGLDDESELEELGYSFANGHLGVTLGNDKAAFYLQAGLSWMRTSAHTRETRPLDMSPGGSPGASPGASIDIASESVFRVWTPSGRVGLIAYF